MSLRKLAESEAPVWPPICQPIIENNEDAPDQVTVAIRKSVKVTRTTAHAVFGPDGLQGRYSSGDCCQSYRSSLGQIPRILKSRDNYCRLLRAISKAGNVEQ